MGRAFRDSDAETNAEPCVSQRLGLPTVHIDDGPIEMCRVDTA